MKAQVLYGIGNLKYTDVKMPVPGEGEALVRVTRCGICGSDVPRIFKTGAHNMPLIPGHEMAGVVEQYVSRPELAGKRVGIFPLIPCKKCPQCKSRHYEMCENYNYLGSRCDGGFAEYLTVPVWNLMQIPDEVSDDDAAMLEPMCVAVHALRQIGLLESQGTAQGVFLEGDWNCDNEKRKMEAERTASDDSSIVVCGLGTIGLLVALFLRDAGYRNVFCIGNKDVQREKLLEMGYEPDKFIDVRNADPILALKDRTDGRGADYYMECIGRSESYEQAVDCAAPLGRIMLVGNPVSDMELKREVYWKILRGQLTLKGTWNSSFYGTDENGDDWRYALEHLITWNARRAAGEAVMLPGELITHRFGLYNLSQGLDIMRRKSEDYVKIMCEIS